MIEKDFKKKKYSSMGWYIANDFRYIPSMEVHTKFVYAAGLG